MSVYQLKLFGMTCVDFYFKLIPISSFFPAAVRNEVTLGSA